VSQTTKQLDGAWEAWCRRFDIVFRDVQTMFHNRHISKNLIAMLEQSSSLHDTAVVKNWIIRNYVHTQCSAAGRSAP
jgi:hypothetical protein